LHHCKTENALSPKNGKNGKTGVQSNNKTTQKLFDSFNFFSNPFSLFANQGK
jgi:hypothetical protein